MVLPASGETRSPRNGPWLGIDQTPATTGCIMVPVEPTEAADTARVLFECAQNKDRFGESQVAFVPMQSNAWMSGWQTCGVRSLLAPVLSVNMEKMTPHPLHNRSLL